MKDYYAILKIPKNATTKEIRNAYLELAKLFHPRMQQPKKLEMPI